MGGGEQGRFGCVRGILFVDETTVVHDEYAVTDELNLGKLTGIEQDRRAAGRQLARRGVNLRDLVWTCARVGQSRAA